MPLKKAIEKLKEYYGKLEAGKTKKIKSGHVEKVIKKLKAYEGNLLEEIKDTAKTSKKKRLKQKLETTRTQIERARWLLDKIE